jgi:hypothetical protein
MPAPKSSQVRPPAGGQENQAPPPSTSIFSPQIQKQFTGSSFRNPAFTTPQKRVDEIAFSEASGAEDSPALSEVSEMPRDTPDFDRREDLSRSTIRPSTANKALFSKTGSFNRSRTPGRGEIPRGQRDKVRKRKRLAGDRDIGSVRSRVPHDSDDSDSDWESKSVYRSASRRRAKVEDSGILSRLLGGITAHPDAPAALGRWFQLTINILMVAFCVWCVWGFIRMMRSDLAKATESQRAKLINAMAICKRQYLENNCAPDLRAPALAGQCDEWEACMNQDHMSIMEMQVSAKNVADIINEFSGALNLRAWVGCPPASILPRPAGTDMIYRPSSSRYWASRPS